MRQLVFIYNELMDMEYQKKLGLDMEFISFGYMEKSVLYYINGRYIALEKGKLKKTHKTNKVYGGLFIVNNSEHFIRILDSAMVCSKTLLGSNHKLDVFHRVKIKVTPISFKTIENFLKLKYNEKDAIEVTAYIGNPENEFIKAKVLDLSRNIELCGFDVNNFLDLLLKYVEH